MSMCVQKINFTNDNTHNRVPSFVAQSNKKYETGV